MAPVGAWRRGAVQKRQVRIERNELDGDARAVNHGLPQHNRRITYDACNSHDTCLYTKGRRKYKSL